MDPDEDYPYHPPFSERLLEKIVQILTYGGILFGLGCSIDSCLHPYNELKELSYHQRRPAMIQKENLPSLNFNYTASNKYSTKDYS